MQDSSRPSRFPRKMTILTGLVVALLVGARYFHEPIRVATLIDPGVLNVVMFLAAQLLILAWAVWLAFFFAAPRFQRWSMALLAVLVPNLPFVFFQPKFSGDMVLKGFEYRFARPVAVRSMLTTVAPMATLDETAPGSFPGFLGSHRNAVVEDPGLDPDWEASPPELLWKRTVGPAWSGTAIASGHVVTMEQHNELEVVSCSRLDDGHPVWEYSHPARYEDPSSLGRFGPRATPQIHQGKVFAQGATGILIALDAPSGKLLWSVDLCQLLGIERVSHRSSNGLEYSTEKSTLSWGRAASPLVFRDLLIVAGGRSSDRPESAATLIALDQKTGEVRWKSGSEMIAYGSPSLATVAGREQVLLMAEDQAMGFDAVTGRELWKYPRAGHSDGDANCTQVTCIDDRQILLTKGYSLGGELIRIDENGGNFSASRVWANPRVLRTKFSCPVLFENHLYAISDGFLECTDLSGRSVWKQRGAYENGQLLLVGQWLVIQSEDGELFLVRASPEKPVRPTPVASVQGICWNNLAISHDRLVVRSDLEMACFRLPLRSQPPDKPE